MDRRTISWCTLWCSVLFVAACPAQHIQTVELKHYPLDGLEGIISRTGVELDPAISSDGRGSLRVTAAAPLTVRLYETGDIPVDDARLIYQARLRCQNVQGQAYLEMWCRFPGKGEFFSRALQAPLSGTAEWSSQETPFFLKKGEDPDEIKLNLVVNGTGTVWIDDIRLIKGPLR
jgi:hypothetical protein